MNILIILLVGLFAFLPAFLLGWLGLRKRFEGEVFGRIYAWDKPWLLVTQDELVKRCYERLQRRTVAYAGLLLVLYLLVIVVVL